MARGSPKHLLRAHFAAVMNVSASFAKDPVAGITNKLGILWTEMTEAIGKSTITLNAKNIWLEVPMSRLPQMSICAASMM